MSVQREHCRNAQYAMRDSGDLFPEAADRACLIILGHAEGIELMREREDLVLQNRIGCSEPFIICADAGQGVACRLGLTPDAYIGDFDSSPQPDGRIVQLSPDAVNLPSADAARIVTEMAQERTSSSFTPAQESLVFQLPPEKDMTDSEAALDVAVQLGFSRIDILGGLGKRLDHTLGNLALLAKYIDYPHYSDKQHRTFSGADACTDLRETTGIHVGADNTVSKHTNHSGFAALRSVHMRMFDGYNSVTMVGPGSYALARGAYKYLGIIPYGGSAIGVTLEGVKYPVQDIDFSDASTLGVSNEIIAEQAHIGLKRGRLLLIQSCDA